MTTHRASLMQRSSADMTVREAAECARIPLAGLGVWRDRTAEPQANGGLHAGHQQRENDAEDGVRRQPGQRGDDPRGGTVGLAADDLCHSSGIPQPTPAITMTAGSA